MATPVHPTAAAGPPPSQVQSAPSLVGFDPKAAVPQQPLYLQRNDVIALNFLSNTNGVQVRINYRFLKPNGEIAEGQLTTAPFNGNLFQTLPLYEAWLLSFAATVISGNPVGQWCFLQAFITRANPTVATSPMHELFWQGFIPANTQNGWPGTPGKELTDGSGTIQSITGTTPAAGAEISETIPTQRRRVLLSFRALFTTSATVANRFPGFQLDDGVNAFFLVHSNNAQTATQIFAYVVSPGNQFYNDTQNQIVIPFPTSIPLKAGFRIVSRTNGLQATDQWSAIQYLVLEWGQWDA